MENKINQEYCTPSSEVIELILEGVLCESGGEASGDAGGESGWD